MVLLMVLAVLTLMCLLGLMFVLMANMERATARAYLDMVRAKMIAQSGIHAAMANTVTVFGRQKAFVVFATGAPIEGAPIVSMIVDDPSPF